MNKEREESIRRANELKKMNESFLEAKKGINLGTDYEVQRNFYNNKKKLLMYFQATELDWNNWRWQIKNRIQEIDVLSYILQLDENKKKEIEEVQVKYRWGVTPYYAALFDSHNSKDPLQLLSIPQYDELNKEGETDPICERNTNPSTAITRRYPDRLIVNVTNACATFCRHCQRKRLILEHDSFIGESDFQDALKYIRDNQEIRDVLITGGDPLTLETNVIDYMLEEIYGIPHIEIVRIGTRVPVTMPQRIDDELMSVLKKYKSLYMNFQFNHPKELTPEATAACKKLGDCGVVMGNQMVLLKDINDDKYVVRYLNQELLKNRVRPYYIFQAKDVLGTMHFKVSINKGLEIMEYLRGNTSGLAIPTYILNAPGGLGKIPLSPNYLYYNDGITAKYKTWEGKKIEIRL